MNDTKEKEVSEMALAKKLQIRDERASFVLQTNKSNTRGGFRSKAVSGFDALANAAEDPFFFVPHLPFAR